MDGENNGKPYFLMDDLGGRPTPIIGLTPKKCLKTSPLPGKKQSPKVLQGYLEVALVWMEKDRPSSWDFGQTVEGKPWKYKYIHPRAN